MVDGYFDCGVVLGTRDYKEADKLVSVLTENHGLVRYLARGVRRQGSKKGPHLDLFQVIRFQVQRGENPRQLVQVESEKNHNQLKKSFDKIGHGLTIVEILNSVVAEEVPDKELYFSLVNYLHALNSTDDVNSLNKLSNDFGKYIVRHLGFPVPKDSSLPLSAHFEGIINRKIISNQIR